jgi:hypothetical protein
VREKMRRGENSVVPMRPVTGGGNDDRPQQQRGEKPRERLRRREPVDKGSVIQNLGKDPSLRFSESGRALLRWLSTRAVGPAGWPEMVEGIPPHCSYALADLARACADEWLEFASGLEQPAEEDRVAGSCAERQLRKSVS